MIKGLVSIIIVNWNGKNHLNKCLPSVFSQNYKDIEIILVDNSSTDGSVKWVEKHFPKVKVITNARNLGFCEANNIGYKDSKGGHILFLNNDVVVTPDFLVNLISAMKKDEKIGGVQSKILMMDDPKRLDSVGSYLTGTGFLYHKGIFEIDSREYSKTIYIYSAKGACMMFKRKLLEEIKVDGEIFDSRYFAYFEETDLCHRVYMAGYKVVFVPESVIYHKLGATSQKLKKPFIEYHSYKNRICSYVKNLGFTNILRILPFHLFLCEGISFIFLLRGKVEIFIAIQKAFIWNLINLNSTLAKRSKIRQNIRKIEDKVFFGTILKNPGSKYFISQLSGWNITRIDKNI